MRVALDHHHGVLWEAFALLFEDRAILGPVDLVAIVDGYYHTEPGPVWSDFPGRRIRAVTREYLRVKGVDLVIATTDRNREPFRTLADSVGALYVDHCGNAWDKPVAPLVLRSKTPDSDPGLLWHPEFHRVTPTDPALAPIPVGSFNATFVRGRCRPLWDGIAGPDWHLFGRVEDPILPWKVAEARDRCRAIWHCKDADGYGFGVHESFASGRPVIGHAEHYDGRLASPLFVRGETYIEPEDDVLGLLADPDRLRAMGRAASERFAQIVDFDREAEEVRAFLEAAGLRP